MTELERTSLGAVPVFYAEGPPPFIGSLMFRVGRADEQAPATGLTHLVEHLALPITGRRALDFNGSVDNILTSFWAAGDSDLVLPFLADTASRLGSLPLERLDTERGILLAEEAMQGPNPTRLAFALRFGPQHHGLSGYEEYGLRVLDEEDVEEWAHTRFVAGNAVVWLTGPPDALELDLAAGHCRTSPVPRELEGISWPAFYSEGPYGVLAFSLLARRSSAFAAAVSILDHRVEERIRYELGLSYSPSAEFIPLTDDLVHVVIVADAMTVNTDRVVEETLAVLDVLAADGPSDEELDDERRFAERSLRDPNEIPSQLFYSAAQQLLGAEFRQPAELARTRAELRREDVAEALRDALDTLLVIAPPETARPERLSAYPLESTDTVQGRTYRPRGFGFRPSRMPQLVVASEGVMLRADAERRVTARFDDCVLSLHYPDNSRTLLTRDGFFVGVDPRFWRGGREAVRAIDDALPAELTVRMEPALTEKVDAVEEVARRSLRRRWLVEEELEQLPERLGEGETPLAFLSATKGMRAGLVVATDRRLIFFARIFGEKWLEWPYERVRALRTRRRPWGTQLLLALDGEEVLFTEVKRRDAEAFTSVVRERLRTG